MWPLPALGCLCLLALLGMFAAQQHRESELRLLTAQQELAQQQARIQDLQRQLRQCKTRRRPGSSLALSLASPASGSAPSNLSLSAGLEHMSEATLAAAELVQPGSVRGAPSSRPAYERFVRVLTVPLVEPPCSYVLIRVQKEKREHARLES